MPKALLRAIAILRGAWRPILFLLLLTSCKPSASVQRPIPAVDDFNALAERFVARASEGQDTKAIRETLAQAGVTQLERALDTNEKQLAFWVNVYNAYIQHILRQDPEAYGDRDRFFKEDQLPIAGKMVSFSKIEHGIIRKSQWEYGLGLVGKPFPGEFERRLRVREPDYRIHFALNCGAKDCPPVAVYHHNRLNEQFSKATSQFLRQSSTYDAHKKEVAVTALFSWFRGDFGGKKGTLEILEKEGIIPENQEVSLRYEDYDWTLALDNFASF
ncbi:DUF547 domain-containing protein [Maribacter sp. 2307ULW6-5]|uniref:DUF547 domain-containing protein n=1 Tax=Maribacter sp. 2307ULW6-5 TaxID=3386275 RepID=UPI0039BD2B03